MTSDNKTPGSNEENQGKETNTTYFTSQSTVADVISDPAFKDFGHLPYLVDRNVPLSETQSVKM